MPEQAVERAQKTGRMETVILRPCWYYGPNQPARQTTFFKMIQSGKPIIFGDGNSLRSMSYVDNTSQALLSGRRTSEGGRAGRPIGSPTPGLTHAMRLDQTVAELLAVKEWRPRRLPDWVSEGCLVADRALQGMGLYIKEIHVAGEMNKTIFCSIEKARRELDYQPRVDLREAAACPA